MINQHNLLWQRFIKYYVKQCLPQALLLIGPAYTQLIDFAHKMAAVIFCDHKIANESCKQCQSCRLILADLHPDLNFLQPDHTNGVIKIEQLRNLQELIFRSPQLSKMRMVVITNAEHMNNAAANCLLKMLEEPPSMVIFCLLAEQTTTILPTVLSRCQQWLFSYTDFIAADYLTIGEKYAVGTAKAQIFAELLSLIKDLLMLAVNKNLLCNVVLKWSKFALVDILWLLYLVNGQMIVYQLREQNFTAPWTESLYELSESFPIMLLFKQLDQIILTTQRLTSHININETLALEKLLLGYVL